jgi:hypothetical protein
VLATAVTTSKCELCHYTALGFEETLQGHTVQKQPHQPDYNIKNRPRLTPRVLLKPHEPSRDLQRDTQLRVKP